MTPARIALMEVFAPASTATIPFPFARILMDLKFGIAMEDLWRPKVLNPQGLTPRSVDPRFYL